MRQQYPVVYDEKEQRLANEMVLAEARYIAQRKAQRRLRL